MAKVRTLENWTMMLWFYVVGTNDGIKVGLIDGFNVGIREKNWMEIQTVKKMVKMKKIL